MINKTPKGSDFYFNAAENAMELKSNPSPHQTTVRTGKKADPTEGAVYTSKLDQALYPKPGTSPGEKKYLKNTRRLETQKKNWNEFKIIKDLL